MKPLLYYDAFNISTNQGSSYGILEDAAGAFPLLNDMPVRVKDALLTRVYTALQNLSTAQFRHLTLTLMEIL